MSEIIREKQDYTYLKWSHTRNSSGTAGTFLKSESTVKGKKIYYKMSQYDSEKGIVGHECINEIIVDRLLNILGIEHLEYQLIHADIEVDGKVYDTYICASYNFKAPGERKVALDDYYVLNRLDGESRYDFCARKGWTKYIDEMLLVDYLIMNRDRHGANIEVLRNTKNRTYRIAPLFDHGVSLLYSCMCEADIKMYNTAEDKACNNFIGSRSTLENLKLLSDNVIDPTRIGLEKHRDELFDGLEDIISQEHQDKIWEMIISRWKHYESLCN